MLRILHNIRIDSSLPYLILNVKKARQANKLQKKVRFGKMIIKMKKVEEKCVSNLNEIRNRKISFLSI